MKRCLIIANWKMNPLIPAEAKRLLDLILKDSKGEQNFDLVICPPFIFLADFANFYSANRQKTGNVFLGAQNCFWEKAGAYTGEISPVMLKNYGCLYVIVGHSERRQLFNENDEIVRKKLQAAIKAGLSPILCLGETENESMPTVIEQQLKDDLRDYPTAQLKNLIIAYEPIWAIGTDKFCQPEKAMEACLLIRRILSQLYGRHLAEKIMILYGGSVNEQNAADYLKIAGMDGLLIGHSSLDIKVFIKILRSFNNS